MFFCVDEGGEVTVNTLGSVLLPLLIFILQTIPLCICELKFLMIFYLWNHWNLPHEKKKKDGFIKIYAH